MLSGLISLRRGFIKEALSLMTWVIAGFMAWKFGGAVAPYFASYVSTPSAQVVAASVVIFIVSLLLGALVSHLLDALVRVTGLSGTDRFLGMAFGAARGILLVVILVGLLSVGPVQQDDWWQQSVLIPHFLSIADWLRDLISHLGGQWMAGSSGPAGN